MVSFMNTFLTEQLAGDLHREMLGRTNKARTLAAVRRIRRAERLTRRSEALARRAAKLVELAHR
jgi:hypothetical protein